MEMFLNFKVRMGQTGTVLDGTEAEGFHEETEE